MTRRAGFSIVALLAAAAGSLLAQRVFAQEGEAARFDIGVRGVLLFGKGQPANDMIGEGLILRWRFREGWHLGIAYDSVTFDFETPNNVLGIESTSVVDGTNDWSRTSVLLERRFHTQRRWDPYWLVGLGLASVDVPTVAGTRAGGGAFDIATDADDEVHVFAGGGLRRSFGEHWAVDATFTFEHHGTDYAIVDRVSGAGGTMGSHSPYGLTLGASYQF